MRPIFMKVDYYRKTIFFLEKSTAIWAQNSVIKHLESKSGRVRVAKSAFHSIAGKLAFEKNAYI